MARLNVISVFIIVLAAVVVSTAFAAEKPVRAEAALDADEVVQRLVDMNARRAQALLSYESVRTYHVDYRGFPGDRSADMIVSLKYTAPGKKEFTVQSATGSKLIIDRVFKKLLEGEQEALTPEMQKRTALNPDNYEFVLTGNDAAPTGPVYVLDVKPKRKDKFLYRGRVWVDGRDFAVVRIEAEPAKNPSFWTKVSNIEQQYAKVGDFWLPLSNRSTSSIRLGGKAELQIDYHDYRVTESKPLRTM